MRAAYCRMTSMTGPDYAVMCNLINTNIHTHTHTHTHTIFVIRIIDPPLGGSVRVAENDPFTLNSQSMPFYDII